MARILELIPEYVDFIPKEKKPGVLYISKRFNVSVHLCCCGNCGIDTVLPFNKKHGWVLIEKGDKVTFTPSIGNWQLPCKSHYFIRDNKVVWS